MINIVHKFLIVHIEYQLLEILDLEKQIHCLIQKVSNQILIKFIYMLKIHKKQNIIFLLANKKVEA